MEIKEIYRRIKTGTLSDDSFQLKNLIEIAARIEPFGLRFLDELALCLAKDFHENGISYDFADGLANDIWHAALEIVHNHTDVKFGVFYEIYEAFDAGEYSRKNDGEHVDPVVKYTRPLIAKIVERVRSEQDFSYSRNP